MSHHRSSTDVPSEDASYIILEAPVSGERKRRILGSVIPSAYVTNPFAHYRPNWKDPALERNKTDLADLEKLMTSLSEEKEAVELTDLTTGKVGNKATNSAAKLTDLFKAYAKLATSQEVTITAGKARRYTFDNPGADLQDRLFQSNSWRSQVQKLINELRSKHKPMLYLVTGVFVCSDIEVTWKRNSDTTAGAGAALNPETVMGNPIPLTGDKLNAEFVIDHNRSNHRDVFAKSKAEVIFAVSYSILEYEYEVDPAAPPPSTSSRILQRIGIGKKTHVPGTIKSVWLGAPIRGQGIDPYAGEDSPVESTNSQESYNFAYIPPQYVVAGEHNANGGASSEQTNGNTH